MKPISWVKHNFFTGLAVLLLAGLCLGACSKKVNPNAGLINKAAERTLTGSWPRGTVMMISPDSLRAASPDYYRYMDSLMDQADRDRDSVELDKYRVWN